MQAAGVAPGLDPTAVVRRALSVEAALGALVGVALWALPVQGAFGVPLVERLVALGPLVVAPLAVEAALRGAGRGWPRRLAWAIALGLPPAAGCAAASVLVAPGPLAGGLAGTWAAFTALVALLGLRRLLLRGPWPVAEVALDAGLLYLPVGGAWLFASRLGWDVMGFGPAITALTAAHFHFAGLAAGAATAQVGRLLASWTPGSRAYEVGAWSVALTPILVAIGITASPLLEVATAVLLATGVLMVAWSVSAVLLRHAPRGRRALTALLALAQLVSAYTMGLACLYAWGEWTGRPWVGIDTMARTHGLLNALGYALPSLVLLRALAPAAAPGEDDAPFARLGWLGRVGADHFERRGLVVAGAPAPRAITRSVEALAGGPVDPDVARYYEDSAAVGLVCRPRWQPGFRLLGRLAHVVGRRCGQIVLPVEDRPQRVGLRLAALDEARVDLPGAVASVRTYEADGGAMYVAAYGEHEAEGRRYMDVALPLPVGMLQSNLRGRALHRPDGPGLELTSVPTPSARHAGIWWCLGPLRVRLPLHETLVAWPARLGRAATGFGFEAPAGASMVALHTFTWLGWPVLALDYVLGPAGGAWADTALVDSAREEVSMIASDVPFEGARQVFHHRDAALDEPYGEGYEVTLFMAPDGRIYKKQYRYHVDFDGTHDDRLVTRDEAIEDMASFGASAQAAALFPDAPQARWFARYGTCRWYDLDLERVAADSQEVFRTDAAVVQRQPDTDLWVVDSTPPRWTERRRRLCRRSEALVELLRAGCPVEVLEARFPGAPAVALLRRLDARTWPEAAPALAAAAAAAGEPLVEADDDGRRVIVHGLGPGEGLLEEVGLAGSRWEHLDAVGLAEALLRLRAAEPAWRRAFPDPAEAGERVRELQRRAGVSFPG